MRERDAIGEEVPMPTFPLPKIAKSEAPVLEATANGLAVEVPCIKRVALPVEVPMLILLLVASARKSGLDDVPTVKEPKIEELPWEAKPFDPMVNPPLATMLPLV